MSRPVRWTAGVFPTEATSAAPGPAVQPCPTCEGTGLIAVEDPVLGGLIDTNCPDCEGQR